MKNHAFPPASELVAETESELVSAQWFQKTGNRRVEYWAIRSSVRSFARTAHSFACSALLASLARSAALIRSLAHGKKFFVFDINASIS